MGSQLKIQTLSNKAYTKFPGGEILVGLAEASRYLEISEEQLKKSYLQYKGKLIGDKYLFLTKNLVKR